MTKYRWALWGLAVLMGLTAARAAALEEPPMQVRVARSAQPGCEPDCAEWISAQGKIVAGQTLHLFKSALRRLSGAQAARIPSFRGRRCAGGLGHWPVDTQLRVRHSRDQNRICGLIPTGDTACGKLEAERKFRATPQEVAGCASACTFVLAGGVRRATSEVRGRVSACISSRRL